MIDLGLSQLTDDQLVELLSEICAEAAQRDPFVRKATQGAINAQANELKIIRKKSNELLFKQKAREDHLRAAVQRAVENAKSEYFRQLDMDVADLIKEEVEAGRFRPVSTEQEANRIAAASKVVICRFHICTGYSPADVSKGIEEFLNIPAMTRLDVNVFQAELNGTQIEKYKKWCMGGTHRLEIVTA
jgi:hypothetical protein